MAPVHKAAGWNDIWQLRKVLSEDPGLVEADGFDHGEWPTRDRPLHHASKKGSVEAACVLLQHGAEISSLNSRGETPLMLACRYGRVKMVALLLARGADPTMVSSSDGRTALMHASQGYGHGPSHVAAIRRLLKDGRVPIDARDKEGDTALSMACSSGHTERVRVLLIEGRPDPDIAGTNRVRPMSIARRHGRQDCVELLKWYKGELKRPFLLNKARAVVDAMESIKKAPEKVGAKTEAEAEKARKEAAPMYLRGRVERGEALPSVEVVGRQVKNRGWEEGEEEEEEELLAVLKFAVTLLKDDLHVELMEGLQLR